MTFLKTSAVAFLLAGTAAFAVLAASPQKVACIGNSITYGTLIDDRESDSYPAQLGQMLGNKYTVDNFGRPGATLLFSGHNPYVNSPEFKAALAFNPDIVIAHLGINDTDPRNWPDYNSRFVKDYVALVDSFKHVNPDVRIIIANLSPITAKHRRFKSGTRDWRLEIRNAIQTVARITGAELIDFARPLIDHPNYLTDGVHPNGKGAGLLARAVYSAITGNYGGLKMPPIYGSGMVLQRYKPLVISGTADAGSTVTLSIDETTVKDIADNRGKWAVVLPPMTECTGLEMKVTDGTDTLTFNDVAVGEVWLASGQSNMEFNLKQTTTYKADSALTDDPLLRLYNMKPRVVTNNVTWNEADLEALDSLDYYIPSSWQRSDYTTAGRFSGVAWYFGKMLRDSLNVPVGIINNAIGGAGTEAWIDIETLEQGLPEALIEWRKNDYIQPWVQERADKNTDNDLSFRHPYEPSYLYATGIRPLGAYPIAGVVWYQGESNAHNIEIHERFFRLLIDSWRRTWNSPQLPFIFTQLSSIDRPSWPQFRDSQRRLAKDIPWTAMAVSSDYGDSLDVHPRNKRPVGERLARQALNRVYSTGITPSGPLPLKASVVKPGTVCLEMEYGSGMKTSDGAAPRTFEVAEVDGIYYPARATFTSDNIITLTSTDIANPRYVRYAWQPFTRANVVNGDNLPASTFKIETAGVTDTDDGIASGISAAAAGIIDGHIIQAGGCNFPVNPLAPASTKKFYQGIYELVTTSDGSITNKKIGMLSLPIAYGGFTTTPKGIVVVGGTTAGKSLSSTFLISLDDNGKAVVTELPSLPVTVDNTSAACLDGKVYVAGGNIDGSPGNSLYVLDMNRLIDGWKNLTSFPGNPRMQPVLAASRNEKDKPVLYLWGGFAPKGDDREATINTDGLMFDCTSGKWSPIPAPVDLAANTISTGGGIAVTLPDGRIVITGGVNKDIFLEALRNQAPDYLSHPVEWYRFNKHILVFDPKTGKWNIPATHSRFARAGAAAAVTPNGEMWIIGGEIKPRIRTPRVSKIKL